MPENTPPYKKPDNYWHEPAREHEQMSGFPKCNLVGDYLEEFWSIPYTNTELIGKYYGGAMCLCAEEVGGRWREEGRGVLGRLVGRMRCTE